MPEHKPGNPSVECGDKQLIYVDKIDYTWQFADIIAGMITVGYTYTASKLLGLQSHVHYVGANNTMPAWEEGAFTIAITNNIEFHDALAHLAEGDRVTITIWRKA